MGVRPVRGTHDLLSEEFAEQFQILKVCREQARCFGFHEMSTPIFEFTSVFKKTLGDSSDIVGKEMYTFEDRGGESITLRPEGTAGIARSFISEGLQQKTPLKVFYSGPMFRYERPQKGRQRQFHQAGVELIGLEKAQADIECISLAYNILKKISPSDVPELVLNSIGDLESRNEYKKYLIQYLTPFEKELSPDSQRRLKDNPMRIWDSKNTGDQKLLEEAPRLSAKLNTFSKDFFEQIKEGLDQVGITFRLDDGLVRGLDYYSHSVFEFKSRKLGAQDTVLAGGRYDGLIEMMGGPKTPGVGWAAGLERLQLVNELRVLRLNPVALVPLGQAGENWTEKFCYDLRSKGFAVELSHSGNLSKRMKKANQAGCGAAILIGSEEIEKGQLTVKDLESGTQMSVPIDSLEEKLMELQISRLSH